MIIREICNLSSCYAPFRKLLPPFLKRTNHFWRWKNLTNEITIDVGKGQPTNLIDKCPSQSSYNLHNGSSVRHIFWNFNLNSTRRRFFYFILHLQYFRYHFWDYNKIYQINFPITIYFRLNSSGHYLSFKM